MPTKVLQLGNLMNAIASFQDILQQGKTTTESALGLFDRLDPVDLEFMLGRWRGSGFHTNHQMDGLLEAFNWYGKEFVSADCVHPLLFSDGNSIYQGRSKSNLNELRL